MNIKIWALSLALFTTSMLPAYAAETPTQSAEHNAALAGGSTGSFSARPKVARPKLTRAQRAAAAAAQNKSPAGQAGAGGQ